MSGVPTAVSPAEEWRVGSSFPGLANRPALARHSPPTLIETKAQRSTEVRLGDLIVKFVMLKSWGGDYLVVVANIAYLRADENGQTKVGMVGGDSLLVTGSIEETAATILAG